MFSDIQSSSANRITEIRDFLDFLSRNIPPLPAPPPRYVNSGKGLIYVQLYGVIEYTVGATISKSINYINNDSIKISDMSPYIFSLILSPELDALIHVNTNKWDKRHKLFNKIVENDVFSIRTDLLPTDGKNIHHPQLKSIWNTFNIIEPIFHDISFMGRLADIVSNRINIAHGNTTSSDVGSRVSINDLTNRINEVSAYCSHFISVFDDYIRNRKYVK